MNVQRNVSISGVTMCENYWQLHFFRFCCWPNQPLLQDGGLGWGRTRALVRGRDRDRLVSLTSFVNGRYPNDLLQVLG